MGKKKVANLSEDTLFAMGDASLIQQHQLANIEQQKADITDGIAALAQANGQSADLLDEAEQLLGALFANPDALSQMELAGLGDVKPSAPAPTITKTALLPTNNNWDDYMASCRAYAKDQQLDLSLDPFTTALGQEEYIQLKKEINDDFAAKTSIANALDLKFLGVAIALQVTKALLFPMVAQKVGYGERFDKADRLAHSDSRIKAESNASKNAFKDSKSGYAEGEWTQILTRFPLYDISTGSPAIGINLGGPFHRLHTLGHDPVLGWVFGTANILTETVTLDTFATYQGVRTPTAMITPQQVSIVSLFSQSIEKAQEHSLNLPAAIVAEKIHLKSDLYTKTGLPVPILQSIAPTLGGKLYKSQYDALCLSRDLKVVGASAAISLLIDMVIGLMHGINYDADKDGTRDMFEVRTKKILLISNTIASTSNLIYAYFTANPQNLDIGGLLVTLSHLVCDTNFIVNVKKEFIENRIYEKIEEELHHIDTLQDKLFTYEYQHLEKAH